MLFFLVTLFLLVPLTKVARIFGSARRGASADLLVVGLGNPGSEFEHTRHNLGADVVSLLADRHGARLRNEGRTRALSAMVALEGRQVALAVPQTYVNESGLAVSALLRRYRIVGPEHLVVVHDELDLPPGRVKVKHGGGTAGHNGLESVRAHIHDSSYVRVRVGVGKPPGRQQGADFVLRRPSKTERVELDTAVQIAADAVETIAKSGVETAMQLFNTEPGG